MTSQLTAIALCALVVASPAAAEMCVQVNVRFSGLTAPPALVDSMTHETSSIWAPYGVRLAWSTAMDACPSSNGSFDVLVDHPRPLPGSTWNTVLGSARLAAGEAIDRVPVYVDHAATEHLLAHLTTEQIVRTVGRLRISAEEVGRALGRVLAHEIGHVILAAPMHQPRGLMRASFFAPDLIRPARGPYTLSDTEIARLRQREIELSGYNP